jgi:valyl-tRNA synthetase
MSKSTGNVIDPLDNVRPLRQGQLRFTLAPSPPRGRDIRLSEERIEGTATS